MLAVTVKPQAPALSGNANYPGSPNPDDPTIQRSDRRPYLKQETKFSRVNPAEQWFAHRPTSCGGCGWADRVIRPKLDDVPPRAVHNDRVLSIVSGSERAHNGASCGGGNSVRSWGW